MEREWKTWSEIAIMIMEQVRSCPTGEKLHKLEFEGMSHGEIPEYFIIETSMITEEEEAVIVECIARSVQKFMEIYDITAGTMH